MTASRPRLRDRVAIAGVGESAIGRVPGVSALGLLVEAMAKAVEDAGVDPKEVDGLICRGPDDVYTFHQRTGQLLGMDAAFSTTLDNGGASQALAIALAAMAIDAGLCEVVLCGYGRDSWSRTHRSEATRREVELIARNQQQGEFQREFGLIGATGMHAFGARRHMDLYGTTKHQLGTVATTFREHARRNPCAQMREPLTMDDYLAGRQVVDPFNVYDCSLVTDGAGAVVVTTAERARDLRWPPVLVSGFGTHNNLRGWFFDEHMTCTGARESGRRAFRMAGLGPEDVSTVQLYDCYTYMVLVQLEDYGFCNKGEGGGFVDSGALALTGSLPANTSGGQLSEGHVEGMLQIVEGVRQLRRALPTERQVPSAEVALVSGHGGNTVCHSSLVLRRGK